MPSPGRPEKACTPPVGGSEPGLRAWGAIIFARLNLIASACLIALIGLCLAWELWLAPLQPGGSWLVLKVLPLLAPLFGILHGRRYTYQWSSMLILAYLTEGIVRAATESGAARLLAAGEVMLSMVFFVATVAYARLTRPPASATTAG